MCYAIELNGMDNVSTFSKTPSVFPFYKSHLDVSDSDDKTVTKSNYDSYQSLFSNILTSFRYLADIG